MEVEHVLGLAVAKVQTPLRRVRVRRIAGTAACVGDEFSRSIVDWHHSSACHNALGTDAETEILNNANSICITGALGQNFPAQ